MGVAWRLGLWVRLHACGVGKLSWSTELVGGHEEQGRGCTIAIEAGISASLCVRIVSNIRGAVCVPASLWLFPLGHWKWLKLKLKLIYSLPAAVGTWQHVSLLAAVDNMLVHLRCGSLSA